MKSVWDGEGIFFSGDHWKICRVGGKPRLQTVSADVAEFAVEPDLSKAIGPHTKLNWWNL